MADQYASKHVKQKTDKDASVEKAYACDICGARFSCQLSVHRHKKIHTSQFKCEVCGKHFSSRYDLETRHMHIHTKTLPFKCSICCQAFRLRKSYKEHTCANITSPVAICDICGDRFLLEIELAKHKETHERKRKAHDTERDEENIEFSKHELESTSMIPSELPPISTSVLHQPQPDNQHHFKYHNTYNNDYTMNNPEPDYINYEQYAPPLTNGSGIVHQQIMTDPSVNNIDLSNSNLTNLVPMIQNMQGNEPDVLYGQPTATPGGFLSALQMPDNNNLNLPLSYSAEQQNMVPVVATYSIQESYEPTQTNTTYVQLQSNGSDQNLTGISQFSNTNTIDMNMYTPTSSMQSMSTSGVTPTNTSHHIPSEHLKKKNPGESDISSKKQLNSQKELNVVNKKAFTVPFAPKRPFQCSLCPKRYYKQSLVDKHMKIHTNPFVCQICGKKFLSKAALELKHMLVHKTENDLKNNVSSDLDDILSSVSSEDYVIEQKEEDNESIMSDAVEDETSRLSMDEPLSNSDTSNSLSPSHVDGSSRNTPNRGDKPFVCKFCNKSYTLQIHLDNHMVIHTNPVICPICGKKFTSQKSLELKHMKVHKTTSRTPSEDDDKPNIHEIHEGNISEPTVNEQHEHNKLADNSNPQESPYSCTYCKKTYTLKVNLDKHMIFHTNPVICPICGKKFHSKEDLETKHMPVHKVENDLKNNVPNEIDDILLTVSNKDYIVPAKEENTQYGLPDCNPTNNLDTFASIAIKQEAIDPSKKGKIFSCSLCNKSYMLQMHLDKHMVLHNNPFVCSHCGKKFGTQLALVTHSKRFHGVQPGMDNNMGNVDESKETYSSKQLKCPHCPKKYSHKFNLDAHMRVHTDPVSCQICGKKFASRFILEKMHMPIHEASKVKEIKSNSTDNVKPEEQQYTNSYGNEQWNQIPPVNQHEQSTQKQQQQQQQPFENSTMNQSQYSYDNVNNQQHQLLDLNQYQYHNQLIQQHQYEVQEHNQQDYQSMSFQQQNFPQTSSNQDVQVVVPQQSSMTGAETTSPETDATVTSAENQQTAFIPDQMIAQALLKDKPYECNVCKKRYSVKVNLAKHMVIHLNPFECKICGKKFLSKKALEEKHMPVHNLSANKNDPAVDANMKDVYLQEKFNETPGRT